MSKSLALRNAAAIRTKIHEIRHRRVILDADLASVYGVTTKVFNQAIRRNLKRFPDDFMFRLTAAEFDNLRSQIVTSSSTHGGRRYVPAVFTEHGAVMAANVLHSQRAIRMSVEVVRAFVQLRQFAMTNAELSVRLDQLETKYEGQFRAVFDTLRELIEPSEEDSPKKPIGFHTEWKD